MEKLRYSVENYLENLDTLRMELGLSQAEFCNQLGVSVSAYQSWMAGTRKPKAWLFINVLNRFRVDVSFLANAEAEDESIRRVAGIVAHELYGRGGADVEV